MTNEPRLIIHCDGGLANRINCLVNGLLLADLLALDYELVWPINRYCRARASDLFVLEVQPIDRPKNRYHLPADAGIIASDNFLSIRPEFSIDPSASKSRREFTRKLNVLLESCAKVVVFYPLPLPQFYFDVRRLSKVLKFTPQIINAVSREQSRLGLRSFTYWGLHLRGTDARRSGAYYSFFARLSTLLPGNSLVLTDDQEIIKLFSSLSSRVITRQGISLVDRYHGSLQWNEVSIDENAQKLPYNVNRSSECVHEALVDLILLSRSIPIPTSTSTFLELSLFLNPIYGGLVGYLFYFRAKISLLLASGFALGGKKLLIRMALLPVVVYARLRD